MKRIRLLLRLLLFAMLFLQSTFSLNAQTTAGTDFWVTFGSFFGFNDPTNLTLTIRIVGGDKPTSVRIDFTHLGTYDVFNISPHQLYDYTLDNTQINAVYNTIMGVKDYSIRITTQKPVSVYAMCGFGNYYPATNVLPVSALGTEYYQISYLPTTYAGSSGLDAYAVLATQNNTQVWHNNILEATLSAGEVYYRTEFADMTNRHITTNYPVAFFAMNQGTFVPHDFWTGPIPLLQQLAPVNTWDKVFFVPVTEIERDIIRIVASKNGTNITQRGGTVRTGVPGAQTNLNGLLAGQFVELYVPLDSAGCFIETNNPVAVCSYIKTNLFIGGVFTLASQTWVPGINQSVTSAKIAPLPPAFMSNITHHYALIYTPSPTKTEVSVGGAPPTALSGGIWHDNAISGMSFYSMPLTNHYTTYSFTNPDGMIIFGYGINKITQSPSSYYYLAYSAMRDLDAAFFANDIPYQLLKDNPICESLITFRAEIEGLAPPSVAERIKWYVDGEHQPAGFNQETWSRSFSVGEYEIRMWVRYENNDTVNKIGTLKICNLDAFFANEVHNEVLPDTTFCNKTVHFRAETGTLSTEPGHIKWYIDYNDGNGYVEEPAGFDQTQWSKDFANGTYPVKMWVLFENGEDATITSTLKIQTLWIKIRNVRY